MSEIDLAKILSSLPAPALMLLAIIVLWRKGESRDKRIEDLVKEQQGYLREHIAVLSRIQEHLDE